MYFLALFSLFEFKNKDNKTAQTQGTETQLYALAAHHHPKLHVSTSSRAGVRTKTFPPPPSRKCWQTISLKQRSQKKKIITPDLRLADQEMLELPEHAKYGKSELRKRDTHMAKNALSDWLEPRGLCETKAE